MYSVPRLLRRNWWALLSSQRCACPRHHPHGPSEEDPWKHPDHEGPAEQHSRATPPPLTHGHLVLVIPAVRGSAGALSSQGSPRDLPQVLELLGQGPWCSRWRGHLPSEGIGPCDSQSPRPPTSGAKSDVIHLAVCACMHVGGDKGVLHKVLAAGGSNVCKGLCSPSGPSTDVRRLPCVCLSARAGATCV